VGTGSEWADLDELRQRFLKNQPLFERLRDEVRKRLEAELQTRGVVAVALDARVKHVASFVKKALRKEYADPWEDISDKVGIRPQLVHWPARELVMDFVLVREGRALHVLNAVSPAFTSSMAFARHAVAGLLGTESAAAGPP
jgi:hypothetical protein